MNIFVSPIAIRHGANVIGARSEQRKQLNKGIIHIHIIIPEGEEQLSSFPKREAHD